MHEVLKGKTILLGLSGSIALYKSCDLLRRLQDNGAIIHCLMTASAQKFVTPLTFSALSHNPVAQDIWGEQQETTHHLSLAEKADLLLIAPASAHTISKLAHGLCNDILSLTALSISVPIILAPAMHDHMWKHPATQENVQRLQKFGAHFVGPHSGALSRGDWGWGRMADVETIVDMVLKILK